MTGTEYARAMEGLAEDFAQGLVTVAEVGQMAEKLSLMQQDGPGVQWHVVMVGITRKYRTKCNSLEEALELARNNRALGFDAWVER